MGIRLLWACLCFALLPAVASAQGDFPSGLSPVATVPAIHGFGTLSATAASTQLSTLTTGPNSAAWPTGTLIPQVYVINSSTSAGIVYLCPLGGTCGTTVGIPIAAGSAYGVFAGSTAMTVYAASTATVVAQW
jgi:hypothetical protein